MLTGEIKSELPKNLSEDKGNSNLRIRIILRNQIYFIFAAVYETIRLHIIPISHGSHRNSLR
jgi:hypothetical protein